MRFLRRGQLVLLGGLVACGGVQPDESVEESGPETGTAESALKGHGPADENNGFPRYYEDTAGLRLQPCIDGGDTNCILGDLAGVFDHTLETVFSSNYPDESFYSYVVSDKIATPGRTALGCGTGGPGKAFALAGVEASFLNGLPAAGDQIVFGRIRIVASGLCPDTVYDFTHPYGTESVRTNDLGQVTANAKGYTEDIGCFSSPCDFTLPYQAPGSRVFTSFAQWDPADLSYGLEVAGVVNIFPGGPGTLGDIATNPGYIGDAATLHTIIGTPNNLFEVRIADGSPKGTGPLLTPTSTTNLFVVAGKKAGDLVARPQGFGGQAYDVGTGVGTTSAPRQITVTNWSESAMTLTGISVGGADAADFALVADGGVQPCAAGLNLDRDETCTISATFTPGALGARSALIDVAATRDDAAAPLPLGIAVSGTGINAADAPVVTLDLASLDFGNVRVASVSAPQIVTLTNTGNAPLEVTGVSKSGANAADFRIVQDTCSSPYGSRFFEPGMTCVVAVTVSPTAPGGRVASLSIANTAGGAPHSVAMTANGTGGLASKSVADATYGFPDWYQDDKGVQVVPCYDQVPDPANPGLLVVDPLCLLPPDTETLPDGTVTWDQSIPLNPPQPFGNPALPVNFPGESFYYAAEALLEFTPCTGSVGKSVGLLGIESTFAGGSPVTAEQITFGRKRFFTKGLCPNTDYQITTPLGTEIITADDAGIIAANTKIDTGCTGLPCTFTEALADPSFASFLMWDPAVLPAAPPGYLGDPIQPHTIVGGTYTVPGTSTPVDYYEIKQMDGTVVASTNLWSVYGKTGEVRGAPVPVAFPATGLDVASAAQTVTITNVDPLNAISVAGLGLGGTNPGDFVLVGGASDTCTGANLAACVQPPAADPSVWQPCPAASSCTVDVVFQPTLLGNREAAVIATHSGALTNPMTLLVTGIAGVPELTLQPSAIVFDDQQQFAESYPHDVVVRNTGTAPLIFPAGAVTLSGANAGEFRIDAENCSGNSVPGGGTCDITVTFAPNVTGLLEGAIDVASNDASSPATLPLSGLSIAPSIGVAEATVLGDPDGAGQSPSMAFQSALWQTSTALQADGVTASSVTIENIGLAPLSISSLAVVGQHPGDFALINNTCTGVELAPGDTCAFDAIFTAQHAGARNATVNIYDLDGTDTLAVVHVGGTGLAPTVAPIALTTFAPRVFNTTSAAQLINVTNAGDGNLVVPAGGVTVTGASADYLINSDTCSGQTMAPGGSCAVSVSFRPTGRGVKAATLHVAGNFDNGTGEILAALTGTGQAPVLSFSSGTYGNQKIGTSSTKGFNITNNGDAPLTITGAIALSKTEATDTTIQFSVVAGSSNKCTAGTVILPGKNCSFNLTFAPTGPVLQGLPLTSQRRVDLTVNSNDPAGVASSKRTTSGNAIP